MNTLSGICKETNVASMANVETLINAFTTVQNARLIVLGGAATKIVGSLVITVNCTDAGVTSRYTHRVSTHLNSLAIADLTTLIAALEVYIAAVLAESAFNADPYFDFTIVTTMTS